MATIIDIADSVVAELNAGAFSQPFTAERHYLPRFDLAEMDDLHVSVVPRSSDSKKLDRSRDSFDYEIDVAVQKRSELDPAELDALMGLVEEIADHLRTEPLSSFPDARCVGVKNEPVYAPDHLERLRQFTSVLTLTYRLWR